jgi:hypothetical protein
VGTDRIDAPLVRMTAVTTPRLRRQNRPTLTLTTMPLATRQQLKVRPNRVQGHGPPRQHVSSEGSRQATGWRTGLTATYPLGRGNWSLLGGAWLRQSTLETTYRARLQFQDGRHPGGSGPGADQDFRFEYAVYDGTAGGAESRVTVLVEPNQPGAGQPPPDRPVQLTLDTRQTALHLEMPLGLRYQAQWHRWQPRAGLGLLATWRLEQRAEVRDYAIDAPDYRFKDGQRPQLLPRNDQAFAAATWISAGTGFALSPRWSLGADLWYTHQTVRRGPNRAVAGSEQGWSLAAGLTYGF